MSPTTSSINVLRQTAVYPHTPAEVTVTALSIVDNTFAAMMATPMNFFFRGKLSPVLVEKSLAMTLDSYRQLAGRLTMETPQDVDPKPGQLYVHHGTGSDMGIFFTNETWDASLSTVLPTPIVDRITDSLPASHNDLCVQQDEKITAVLPVAKPGHVAMAQLTTFQDGSVLAFRILHCLVDAHAAVGFVNAWADTYTALDAGKEVPTPKANFEPGRLYALASKAPEAELATVVKALPWAVLPETMAATLAGRLLPPPPPPPPGFLVGVENSRQILVNLSPADIERIYAACKSVTYSRHDAVLGFVGTAIAKVRALTPDSSMTFGMAIGMRPRLGNPRLGHDFVGSPCFGGQFTLAAKDMTPVSVARQARATIEAFNDKTLPAMLAVIAKCPAPSQCLHVNFGPEMMGFSSWLNCDLYATKFGAAGPVHVQAGFQGIDGIAAILRVHPGETATGKWYDEGVVVQLGLEKEATAKFVDEFGRMMKELEKE